MNEIKLEGEAMTNESGRAERCPSNCGAWRDKERILSGPGGFKPCSDPWHDAPTAASTGTQKQVEIIDEAMRRFTPAPSEPGSAEQLTWEEAMEMSPQQIADTINEFRAQLQEREREQNPASEIIVILNNAVTDLQQKLAASEAAVQRLREALEVIRDAPQTEWTWADMQGHAEAALAQPGAGKD